MGFITYHSLLSSNQIEDAVLYDKVILKEEVWDCAARIIEEGFLDIVPVFDMDGTLIYFAEHDAEFCGMIRNKDILYEKKKPYREIMMQGFDGKVCERIVSFFQNN